ncbi:DNA mismatch repair protein MutS [Dyadobacter sp. CY345]|uniref:MutS-related protein n=1 Tax=Dyadobacter sp. CY345 TaxID=2909335 RepID=UPI001F2B0095|nr:DNA mismatch repair protein MutS [Dyadobacter sp. CY345]MCF2442973.1 DNA mismatch repair protein MutS [Dyadobacter sp. CY345]
MNTYKTNIRELDSTLTSLSQSINRLSTFRLAAFVCSVIAIIFLANERFLVPLFFVIPLCFIGFGLLITHYNKLHKQRQRAGFLKKINETEVARLTNKFENLPMGESFVSLDHAYASDFDVFGTHSLFQLINRTTTESGRQLLADWLSRPATKSVILKRQGAIKELAHKLNWRQDFQVAGMRYENSKSDYNKLLEWVEKPGDLLDKESKYRWTSIVMSILSTISAGYFIYGLMYFLEDFLTRFVIPLVVSLFVNARFLKKVNKIAEEIIDSTHQNLQILSGYHSLITQVETEKFESEYLREVQSTFAQNNYSAADEIEKLKKILEVFQNRGTKRSIGRNEFYTIFNNLWLLDIRWILLTEKWKLKNSGYLKYWATAVSEFEVLCSIAGFAYSNPSFCFPEIEDEPYTISFTEMGHPLIATEKRICNNFNLAGRGELAMITGSNMAGKSTFLRTVGLNLVLALMGAPCCARSARVSNMKIFTSMRTQDNLEEGISSFYAELKRIEQLLKLIESQEPIFFLLDEMFKGTNSKDRYKGGASLIKQLSEMNAFGIISTHDLELAHLTENNPAVENFSFNSEITDDEIHFNYRLTKGICTDFNASELMKKCGIKIISDINSTYPD